MVLTKVFDLHVTIYYTRDDDFCFFFRENTNRRADSQVNY